MAGGSSVPIVLAVKLLRKLMHSHIQLIFEVNSLEWLERTEVKKIHLKFNQLPEKCLSSRSILDVLIKPIYT